MTNDERQIAEKVARWCGWDKHPHFTDKWYVPIVQCLFTDKEILTLNTWHDHIWPKVEERGRDVVSKWYGHLRKHVAIIDAVNASALDRCKALVAVIDSEEPEEPPLVLQRFADNHSSGITMKQLADALRPYWKGES